MKLRTRFNLVLAACSLAVIAAAVLVTRSALIHTAYRVDRARAETLLQRGVAVLENERVHLSALAACRAVAGGASGDGAESSLDIRTVMGPGDAIPAGLPEQPAQRLLARAAGGPAAAWLVQDNTLWLAAAAPCGTRPERRVLAARALGAAERERLARLIHRTLVLAPAAPGWVPGRTDVRILNARTLTARTALDDGLSTGRILLDVTLPREAYIHMLSGLGYLTGWIVVCGFAVALLAFWLLQRWVLRSVRDAVEALNAGSASIAAGDQRPRLIRLHADEMGELVDAVNGMLATFERAQARLRASEAEAAQAQRLAALGTLVAGIAHEVNNPNGIVSLNMNVLRRLLARLFRELEAAQAAAAEPVRAELDAVLDETLRASERIARLVASLKSFARPASDTPHEPLDIGAVVRGAAEWMRHDIRKADCRLTLDLPPGLPPVTGRKDDLQQVFINLIQNACHAATHPAAPIAICAAADSAAGTVTVSVHDAGSGIAKEDIDRVLDPFYTKRRGKGGTGLGLSISAAIVKAHGGTLRIRSELGIGTDVSVTLPAAPQEDATHDDG
jgi:signal transduction histidine kinase